MIVCPRCHYPELRVHGTRSFITFARGWPAFWRKVPRIAAVALDASCANCLYAFTLRESGIEEAPLQTAHDQLQEVMQGLKVIQGTGRKSSEDEKPVPRVAPRPAPDPRKPRR